MVDRGNADKYRNKYSAGIKADNEGVWGRNTARERYGSLNTGDVNNPKDQSYPQFRTDQRGPDWKDDSGNDWRRGFGRNGSESAESKPGYVPGLKGKR